MIRNDSEYREAVQRLTAEKQRMKAEKDRLRSAGLDTDEVKRVTDPMRSFHLQLVEEVEHYERLKRGEFSELQSLRDVGQLLIAARIAQNLSQRDLAQLLGVDESQVSRDERNEYHGIKLDRAARILEVLGIGFTGHAERVGPVHAEPADA